MRFIALFSLALPALALAQSSVNATISATVTTSAAPSATPDYEAICEEQAYGYADVCPQCLYRCENTSYVADCYYSTFFTINGIEADCEARGGWNCKQTAVNDVCPGP